MRTIKIISGTYGYHENGRIVIKDGKSEPFAVQDEKAIRLVKNGIAVFCEEIEADAAANEPVEKNAEACIDDAIDKKKRSRKKKDAESICELSSENPYIS